MNEHGIAYSSFFATLMPPSCSCLRSLCRLPTTAQPSSQDPWSVRRQSVAAMDGEARLARRHASPDDRLALKIWEARPDWSKRSFGV
jgi:hypothetical protein